MINVNYIYWAARKIKICLSRKTLEENFRKFAKPGNSCYCCRLSIQRTDSEQAYKSGGKASGQFNGGLVLGYFTMDYRQRYGGDRAWHLEDYCLINQNGYLTSGLTVTVAS